MEGEKANFTLEESTKIQRYSSTLSLTWALDGVVSQRHAPAGFPRKETRYPLYSKLDVPMWADAEKLAPPGFNHRTVQPVASRYTELFRPTKYEGWL